VKRAVGGVKNKKVLKRSLVYFCIFDSQRLQKAKGEILKYPISYHAIMETADTIADNGVEQT
jgi:hypothetical protein